MHLSSLHLRNFRNYQSLDVGLPPGLVVLAGGNAQGKSNLLEAAYLMALGRSPRASSEREVVGWSVATEGGHARVAATVTTKQGELRLQVDYLCQGRPADASGRAEDTPGASGVLKRVRLNGIPRRVSDLVGKLNAVMFDASDIHVVEGPPFLRRRYLDILLAQTDPAYLRALQRYQQVLARRNHLLRLLREGRARHAELEFWDGELVQQGGYILWCRLRAAEALARLAAPAYAMLKGNGESLALEYVATAGEGQDEHGLRQQLQEALLRGRQREVALGATHVGPHRDDLHLTTGGHGVGVYGSRGERRLAALALRLAEGEYMAQCRGDEPVLLLDDILSELDATRCQRVLEAVGRYGQVLLTTTEASLLELADTTPAATFRVVEGTVTPA